MAARGKARGGQRRAYERKSVDERIVELQLEIEELKARIAARASFSAARLKAERARLELNGAEFAELVGVSMVTIYAWENGRSRPRPRQLERLQEVFRLSQREAWDALGLEELDDAGFSPEALRAERARLGLSAKNYGRLLGVTMLTIYNWEKGRSYPRSAQLEKWAAIKGISQRAAQRRLG